MGVTFVVENRPGGSGAKAIAKVAQARADGSVFYVTTPTYIQTTLLSKLDFGYDSLDPLVTIFRDLKIPGVFEDKRLVRYPDVPTAREQGFDVVVTKFRSIAGPKGLPPAVVQMWEQAIQSVLALPEYQKIYKSENLVPAYRNQQESREFTAEVAKSLATSLRELGIIK